MFEWLGSLFGYLVQFFYDIFKNYGVAIILFTIITRVLMFPLTIKQQKSAAANARLQPKMNALKQKYGNDKQALNEAMMELQQKEGMSPFSGCLPMLIQFPLILGLYEAIRKPLSCVLHISKDVVAKAAELFGFSQNDTYFEVKMIEKLRSFADAGGSGLANVVSGASVSAADVVSNAGAVVSGASVSVTDIISNSSVVASASDVTVTAAQVANVFGSDLDSVMNMTKSFKFLGIDLLSTPAFWNVTIIMSFIVFIASAGGMILSNRISKAGAMQGCNPNVMAVFMGAFSTWISFSVPAALALYWAVSSMLAPLQSWVVQKYYGPVSINAKAEAQRLATIKINENKIIDEINTTKGRIILKPKMPEDVQENVNDQGKKQNQKKNQSKKKKNSGGSDYTGRKK